MRTTPLLEDGRPMSLAGALGRYMYRIDSECMLPFLTSHAKTLLIDAIACTLGGVSTEIVKIADRQAGSSHRSEEPSELQLLMPISFAVFCLKKKTSELHLLIHNSYSIICYN